MSKANVAQVYMVNSNIVANTYSWLMKIVHMRRKKPKVVMSGRVKESGKAE